MFKGMRRRREQWRPVLEAEVVRWSAKSCEQLTAELTNIQAYEVIFNGKSYQVEVELLENTETYLHVGVSVDDGSIPASLRPISTSFIREKPSRSLERIANDERPTTNDEALLP
jgi:hypothetical protein